VGAVKIVGIVLIAGGSRLGWRFGAIMVGGPRLLIPTESYLGHRKSRGILDH
jgi:hypothetical protein